MTRTQAKAKGPAYKGWARRSDAEVYRRIHNLVKFLHRHKGRK